MCQNLAILHILNSKQSITLITWFGIFKADGRSQKQGLFVYPWLILVLKAIKENVLDIYGLQGGAIEPFRPLNFIQL